MTLSEERHGVGKVEEEVKGAEEQPEDQVAGLGVLGRRRGHLAEGQRSNPGSLGGSVRESGGLEKMGMLRIVTIWRRSKKKNG